MIRSKGRLIALSSVAVLLFAACTSGGASPSAEAPTTAPTEAASAPADSPAAGPIEVGYLPKDIVNQYFAAAKTGIDKAVTELGGAPVTTVGPNTADGTLQIPFITDLTTQGVDAIIVSAATRMRSPLRSRRPWRPASRSSASTRPLRSAPTTSSSTRSTSVASASASPSGPAELAPNCTGEIAILSAAATATNQNEWIELMKTTLATDSQVREPEAHRHRLRQRRRDREHDPGPGAPGQVPRPEGHRGADHRRHPRGGPGRQQDRQVGIGQGDRTRPARTT